MPRKRQFPWSKTDKATSRKPKGSEILSWRQQLDIWRQSQPVWQPGAHRGPTITYPGAALKPRNTSLSRYWRSRSSGYLPLEISLVLRSQQDLLKNLDSDAVIRLDEVRGGEIGRVQRQKEKRIRSTAGTRNRYDRDTDEAAPPLIALATDLFALGAPLPPEMVDVITGATMRQLSKILFSTEESKGIKVRAMALIESALDAPRMKTKVEEYRYGKFMSAYIRRLEQFMTSPAFRQVMVDEFKIRPELSPLMYCFLSSVDPGEMEVTTEDGGEFSVELINQAYDTINTTVPIYDRRRGGMEIVTDLKDALEALGFVDHTALGSGGQGVTDEGDDDDEKDEGQNSQGQSENRRDRQKPREKPKTRKRGGKEIEEQQDPMLAFMQREFANVPTTSLPQDVVEDIEDLVEYRAEQFVSNFVPDEWTVMRMTPLYDLDLYEKYKERVAPWIAALRSKVGATLDQPERLRMETSGRLDRRRAPLYFTKGNTDIFTRWAFDAPDKRSIVVVVVDLSASVDYDDVLPQTVLIWESLRDVGEVKVLGYQTNFTNEGQLVLWDLSPQRQGILHLGELDLFTSDTVPLVGFEAAAQQFDLYPQYKDKIMLHLTDGHPNVLVTQAIESLRAIGQKGVQSHHLGVGKSYSASAMTQYYGKDFEDAREPELVSRALLNFFTAE